MDDHCYEAVGPLYFYLDGELTCEQRVVIAAHWPTAPLRRRFRLRGRASVVIAQRCRERVPEGLRARVYEALRGLEDPSAKTE